MKWRSGLVYNLNCFNCLIFFSVFDSRLNCFSQFIRFFSIGFSLPIESIQICSASPHSFSLPIELIQIPFRLHTCLVVQYSLSILLLPSNFDFKICYCTSEFTDIYFNILQTINKRNPAAGVKIPYLVDRVQWSLFDLLQAASTITNIDCWLKLLQIRALLIYRIKHSNRLGFPAPSLLNNIWWTTTGMLINVSDSELRIYCQ